MPDGYAFVLWSGADHIVLGEQVPPFWTLCGIQTRARASHLQRTPSVDRRLCDHFRRALAIREARSA